MFREFSLSFYTFFIVLMLLIAPDIFSVSASKHNFRCRTTCLELDFGVFPVLVFQYLLMLIRDLYEAKEPVGNLINRIASKWTSFIAAGQNDEIYGVLYFTA